MNLNELLRFCTITGLAADPRSAEEIQADHAVIERLYKEYSTYKEGFFDDTWNWNPYGDSRIINGTGTENIKALAVGIDIETPELLLLDRLREKGQAIDAVFIHHPESTSYMHLGACVPMQKKILTNLGVPGAICDEHLEPRIKNVYESIHHRNLFREQRSMELLNFPALGCHTPTDNLAWEFMENNICNKEFNIIQDILNALLEVPEYKYHADKHNPPICVAGKLDARPGKIVCTEFTGGAPLPEALIEAQAKAGVGTILAMSVKEKAREIAKEHGINIIMCGHMASDSLGINLMLDKVMAELEPELEVIELAGFMRVKR